jgi:hypothetical protein
MRDASKSFPQDFLSCGKPINGGADPRFYRPVDAPVSPCRSDEERAEWAYWNEQERLTHDRTHER